LQGGLKIFRRPTFNSTFPISITMKKTFFTFIFSLSVLAAYAQEQAVYSHYQLLPVLVNPGYTGFENKHQFIANVRNSWSGFPGRPNTYTVMYNGPVGDKLALGGGIYSENIGDMSLVKLQLNYAFRFRIQKAQIGIGLSTEFLRRQIDSKLLDHPLIDNKDDILEQMADGQQIFDASLGLHMLYDERFFLSLALPNTIRTRLDDVPVDNSTQTNGILSHYIFQIGYIANIATQNFKIIPSLTMRQIRDTPYQIDLNLQARFLDEKLIAGLTFRPSTKGAAAFLIGTKYKQFQLFYSYDLSFSKFQEYNGGSHELTIAYAIPRKMKAGDPVTIEPLK